MLVTALAPRQFSRIAPTLWNMICDSESEEDDEHIDYFGQNACWRYRS